MGVWTLEAPREGVALGKPRSCGRNLSIIQMKKFMFAACAALMSLTMSAQQNTHAVKANPLGFFVGQYQLGYEHALNDNFSVQLSAGFIGGTTEGSLTVDSVEVSSEAYKKTGFIAIPEVRWYPGGSACEGFYIAALGRFRSATTVNETDDVLLERSANGAAVVLGYQKATDGYMVDFFIGPQYKVVSSEGSLEAASSFFTSDDPMGVRLGVNVGFGW